MPRKRIPAIQPVAPVEAPPVTDPISRDVADVVAKQLRMAQAASELADEFLRARPCMAEANRRIGAVWSLDHIGLLIYALSNAGNRDDRDRLLREMVALNPGFTLALFQTLVEFGYALALADRKRDADGDSG